MYFRKDWSRPVSRTWCFSWMLVLAATTAALEEKACTTLLDYDFSKTYPFAFYKSENQEFPYGGFWEEDQPAQMFDEGHLWRAHHQLSNNYGGASRRLLLFRFANFVQHNAGGGGGEHQQRDPDGRPDHQKPQDFPRAWAPIDHQGDGNCHCPKEQVKAFEHVLIRYCGGYKDNNCCEELRKENAGVMHPCCQKQICDNTGWTHGNVYLPMCFRGWKCG